MNDIGRDFNLEFILVNSVSGEIEKKRVRKKKVR
jgi:hypothetical protein